ncbi:MAG: hypothetical protein QOJ35_846 [Solirubrobacteraceae bacterium]|nr:hypothetical protein [Solirubrobacteraceae bacterium]
MSVEQAATEERAKRSQPLVFISHRHADREIADVVREFMRYRSGGDVEVFQTSSADAQAPKIGRNVNREIMKALWRSEVLVLIYTSQDRDWDYCMWECGVATHRESDDTNVIVLQCGRQLPRVFADQVAVDVRDPEKLRRFVNAFLTDADFFPGREEPVTRFQPHDANVERASRSLFEELQDVIRLDDDHDQVEEWPAVPFVRLGLTAGQVREIIAEDDDDHARQATARLLLEATVLSSDREAAALFGRPTLPADEPFGRILPRAVREGELPDWLTSLVGQVTRAVQWNFPTVRWGLMRSANENDGTWYSPVLTHVRRYPSKAMQFDVHFQRFACPPGAKSITLPLPDDVPRAADATR